MFLVIATLLLSRVAQEDQPCDLQTEAAHAPAVPAQISVLTSDGGLVAEWTASEYGLIQWTSGKERLVFLASETCGLALTSGSPEDAVTRPLVYPSPFWRYQVVPGSSLVQVSTDDGTTWIRLSGPLAEAAPQPPGPENGVKVRMDGVYLGERRVAANRGQDFSVLWSPSRSWWALIARQPVQTRALYRITTDARDLEWIRIVPPTEDVPDRAQLSSPDGRWQISADRRRIVNVGAEPSSVRGLWSPSGRQAATLDGEGVWLLGRNAPARLLIAGCCNLGLVDWRGSHLYYTVGRFGEGDN